MPPRAQPMRIRLSDLLKWVAPTALAVGLAGAYPTWLLGGGPALCAQACAGAIVLAAVMVSSLLVAFSAWAGPSQVTTTFIASGLLRVAMCVGPGAVLLWKDLLPPTPLLVWLAVFYLALFVAEGAWVARALREHTAHPSLDELMRPRAMTRMDIE
ncbi:MAG TPA: hypothetical protein VM695_08295 [Phycisphaerae bacterium]|nr:hypothetical protein [Phycisphaerae bacterium]